MTALRQQMLNDLRLRNLSENTQRSYLQSVTGLARYYRRSPDQLSVEEVQNYLLYLCQERRLSWKSCNTIRHGLRFFYRVTLNRPVTVFYVISNIIRTGLFRNLVTRIGFGRDS